MTTNRPLVEQNSTDQSGRDSVTALEGSVRGHGCLDGAPQLNRAETFELVDLTMQVATQFALQDRWQEAAQEVNRAAIYLRELRRLRDGQPG